MGFWRSLVRGITAFRQAYVASEEPAFETVEARRARYRLFAAFYENTAYSSVHKWATSFKSDQQLYKHIRNIYNPSYRIAEFHKGHIFGGSASIEDPTKGAIPIQTDNPALLPAVARLWTDSNIQVLKDVLVLRGAIEGDVFLRIVDDVTRRKVMLERVDPYTVADVTFDEVGNVKGYIIEETRQDPTGTREVEYRLEVTRDGQNVVYRTYLNNAPYGWYGQPSEWAEPYGFVPLVHIKHNDVGLDFGWSEIYPIRPKIQELDEQASMLSDYLRKYHDPIWLMAGKKLPNISISDGNTEQAEGRNRIRTLSGFAEGTKAQALVADMKVNDTLAHIAALQEELERDYPELQTDIWASGSTSGRALRVARQRVESKVYQRRATYDDGLVRAQQMAIAIGGFRGYMGYEGFGLESYDRGALDHRIADRPVFELDPMDQVEIDKAEWEIINSALKAGATLEGILQDRGWSQERIALLTPGTNRVEITGE